MTAFSPREGSPPRTHTAKSGEGPAETAAAIAAPRGMGRARRSAEGEGGPRDAPKWPRAGGSGLTWVAKQGRSGSLVTGISRSGRNQCKIERVEENRNDST